MSALLPIATSNATYGDVRFGPIADIYAAQQKNAYSITSAVARIDCGMVRPSALAALRLSTVFSSVPAPEDHPASRPLGYDQRSPPRAGTGRRRQIRRTRECRHG